MRLFVAVNFDREEKKRILDIQERLRAQSPRGNFTAPENLHLTLVFMGETAEENLEAIIQIIGEIRESAFEIPFNRAGCFVHSHKELWWMGAESNSAGLSLLRDIHGRLVRALLAAGISVDDRPFNAHITLAREIKHARPIVLDCPEINVRVNRISLMKSERVRGVLTHTELFGRELRL